MDKIIIPSNGQTAEEVESAGFFHAIPMDALMPVIEKMSNLRPWDKIDGIIITSEDIRVKISQKVGRKPKNTDQEITANT